MPAKNRIEVTQTGAGQSAAQVMDYAQNPFNVTLDTIVTGTVSYTIEATADDPFLAPPTNWHAVTMNTVITALAVAAQGALGPNPWTAVRINQASGSGSVTLRIIQPGRRTA